MPIANDNIYFGWAFQGHTGDFAVNIMDRTMEIFDSQEAAERALATISNRQELGFQVVKVAVTLAENVIKNEEVPI